jgi:hypothetical protein
MIRQHAIGPTRTLVILMICASLLLGAVSYGVLSVQVVRDPQNAAFVGNTIDTTTTTGSAQIVRDPDNAAYVGNTLDTTTRSVPPVRDPANPHWTGATTTETGASGAASHMSDETAIRGATQGLR